MQRHNIYKWNRSLDDGYLYRLRYVQKYNDLIKYYNSEKAEGDGRFYVILRSKIKSVLGVYEYDERITKTHKYMRWIDEINMVFNYIIEEFKEIKMREIEMVLLERRFKGTTYKWRKYE